MTKKETVAQKANKYFKLSMLSLAVSSTAGSPIVHAVEQRRSSISNWEPMNRISTDPIITQSMTSNIAEVKDFTHDQILNKLDEGRAKWNDDKSVAIHNLTAAEAKTNPMVQITQASPVVFSSFDPGNDLGTIQVASSQRHSDGSATLTIQSISPRHFERRANGGQLSDIEYQTLVDRFDGVNPFAGNMPTGGRYDHTFARTNANAIIVAVGLMMQNRGALTGLHVNLTPVPRIWQTKKKSLTRVTVTTHLESEVEPEWFVLKPRDEFNHGAYNFFTLDGESGETVIVNSGIQSFRVSEFGSNFPLDKWLLIYYNMSKSGWNGFAMVLFTFAIGVATAGAGMYFGGLYLGGLNAVQVGAIAAGAVGGVSLASGTLDEQVSTSPLNITSVTSKSSYKNYGDFGDRYLNAQRDMLAEGVFANRPHGNFNRQTASNWDNLVDPTFTWQRDSRGEFIVDASQFKNYPKPDESKMFDNVHDNPNFGQNKFCGFLWSSGSLAGIGRICRPEPMGDGKN